MEDFSLIILCKGKEHLLPLTLDTLKPQRGSFEVLLLDGEGEGRLARQIHRYPEIKIRVKNAAGKNLAQMMNEGLAQARGKYIQFLQPGDRYISQHGLEFLTTLIGQQPHLVYSSSLINGGVSQDELIMAHSPWFLRSKVLEIGGFDQTLTSCPSLDFLCRLFRHQGIKTVSCKRVLVDARAHSRLPVRETCKILYRYFGLWRALRWFFVQDRSAMLERIRSFLKEAFWRET